VYVSRTHPPYCKGKKKKTKIYINLERERKQRARLLTHFALYFCCSLCMPPFFVSGKCVSYSWRYHTFRYYTLFFFLCLVAALFFFFFVFLFSTQERFFFFVLLSSLHQKPTICLTHFPSIHVVNDLHFCSFSSFVFLS